ncbi:dihydrolipoyl dehydrogenase family protein [Granulicoccus phenolivorans]|uniref:dihydrolipoyl dehydrogenase family protein n=1 Tax=Granulicoccus phenolivorans TaxID=266854 RepID=UPI0003FBA421|nr:NAD(P)/FAD-dependent oxidoreductase [Granulicoccus phenolivorans]
MAQNPDTRPPESDPRTFDIVVIGAGPVGENIAQYATEGTELTSVLIEAELVGGECSYWACMPSKALLRPVDVVETAHHLPGVTGAQLDRDALLRRRDYWVSDYNDAGQVGWAEGAGIPVIRGHGRLSGERQVTVTTAEGEVLVTARRHVVLATGSSPTVPELYAGVAAWGSRDATGVREIPARLVIIGGGVVACEAATWLRALGSRVTLLVRGDRLLDRAEPAAGEHVRQALTEAGVTVRFGAEVTECVREEVADTGLGRIHGGPVTVRLGAEELVADEILVATGRRPRLADVGLPEDAGDAPEWLIAVGDASGEAPLTHWGKYRARVIGERIAAAASGRTPQPVPEQVPVPQVVFTTPQVAWVGLTEQAARDAGHDVEAIEVPWGAASGASLLREDAHGMAKLVVDRATHRVLGASFVGPEAGELLQAATIAIVGQVPTEVLRHAVPSYPTASELWLRLLDGLPTEFRWPA